MVEVGEDELDLPDILTPYGVAVRYPHELGLEDRHTTEAIESAQKLIEWAESQIEDDEETSADV